MYYLMIRIMNRMECIDSSETDTYTSGMAFNCADAFECHPGTFLRRINIECSEDPGSRFPAEVWKDL
jgi:hypothetical protein